MPDVTLGWFQRNCDVNLVPCAGSPTEICVAVASLDLASKARWRKSLHVMAFRTNVSCKTIQLNWSLRCGCLNRAWRPISSYFSRSFHSSSPKQYPGWPELTRSTRGSGILNENHSLSSKLIPPKRSF